MAGLTSPRMARLRARFSTFTFTDWCSLVLMLFGGFFGACWGMVNSANYFVMLPLAALGLVVGCILGAIAGRFVPLAIGLAVAYGLFYLIGAV